MRHDVQFLRAIAVAAVVLFHLDPAWLPGGYIGVDVFFVISGFLITTHLLKRPPETGRDLAEFWARRVRRLVPVALTVLVLTLVAARLWMPETQFGNISHGILAAALYVSNWFLAANSVDYLAEDNAASPMQHYWSLSVEEQFYLVWPIIVLACMYIGAWLWRKRHAASAENDKSRSAANTKYGAHHGTTPLGQKELQVRVFAIGLGLITAASLTWSIIETVTNPAVAYFDTATRAWEFGLGGMGAVVNLWRGRSSTWAGPRARTVVACVGLAGIVASCWVFTPESVFPGVIAALPVLSALLVILADAPMRGVLGAGGIRPVQWLGGVSYSVYLWHWPAIIILPYALGHNMNGWMRLGIVIGVLALSQLSKKYIEDRYRKPKPTTRRPLRKAYIGLAAGMAIVTGLSLGANWQLGVQSAHARSSAATLTSNKCFGAAAFSATCNKQANSSGELAPTPLDAATDKSSAYARNCIESPPFTDTPTCEFGKQDAKFHVALVGNSHATHWLPALYKVAQKRGWKITTYFASQCTVTTTPANFSTAAARQGCLAWSKRVIAATSGEKYDLVIVSERTQTLHAATASGKPLTLAKSAAPWRAGYENGLKQWRAAGTSLAIIRDTPDPGTTVSNIPDCVAVNRNSLAACSGKRSTWELDDPLVDAARSVDNRIGIINLNNHICRNGKCYAVVGNAIVYFDASHLTKTFSQSMSPFLAAQLERILRLEK